MSLLYQCLSADDLKDLTPEDLEILLRIIEHELPTSTGIRRILRRRVQQALADLRQKRSTGTDLPPYNASS